MDVTHLADRLVADGVVGALQLAWHGPDGVDHAATAGAATSDSRFALASLTKPIVAMACLIACEEGILGLDAPIPNVAATVTLREVLSHAGGYAADDARARRLQVDPATTWLDVAAAYREVASSDPARSRRTYSNVGYAIAAVALEDASGMPFSDYIRAAVLTPLGLQQTTFGAAVDDPSVVDVAEPGLLGHGQQLFNGSRFRALGLPQSGAYSTASDYLVLLQTVARGGVAPDGTRLLADETCVELLTNQCGVLSGGVGSFMEWDRCDWAIGFELRDAKEPHWTGTALSVAAATHFGSAGTLAFLDPAHGSAGVILGNRGTYSRWMLAPEAWPALCAAMTR